MTRTDRTTAGKLVGYVASLIAVGVLGYALGGLTGASLPAGPPDEDGMSEMTSTDHRREGT